MKYARMFGQYHDFVVDRAGAKHAVQNVYGTAERGVITDIF